MIYEKVVPNKSALHHLEESISQISTVLNINDVWETEDPCKNC